MEATIGPILGKLDTILGRIDDAKRMKIQKKAAMQNLITTIEEDEQRELLWNLVFFAEFLWVGFIGT